MRFTGTIEAKVDAKGRVFFPAAFRRVLQTCGEEQLVLKRDAFEPCLVFYPWSVWNAEVDELRSQLSRWNARHAQIFRRFVADVEIMSLDSNGRLLLPKRYQQMAGIGQDVVFVAMDNTVELWAKELLEKSLPDDETFENDLQEIMSGKL